MIDLPIRIMLYLYAIPPALYAIIITLVIATYVTLEKSPLKPTSLIVIILLWAALIALWSYLIRVL